MYKTDRNHLEIKQALIAAGCVVFDGAPVGSGFPDLVAARRGGPVQYLEVKDPKKPPSARKLNPREAEFQRQWSWCYHVVLTAEDALRAVGLTCVCIRPVIAGGKCTQCGYPPLL